MIDEEIHFRWMRLKGGDQCWEVCKIFDDYEIWIPGSDRLFNRDDFQMMGDIVEIPKH